MDGHRVGDTVRGGRGHARSSFARRTPGAAPQPGSSTGPEWVSPLRRAPGGAAAVTRSEPVEFRSPGRDLLGGPTDDGDGPAARSSTSPPAGSSGRFRPGRPPTGTVALAARLTGAAHRQLGRVTSVEPGTALSRSQAERRRCAIAAAIDLGAGGGYDAVQMRDLSARSDVARHDLPLHSLEGPRARRGPWEWVEDLDGQIARRPAHRRTTADRMVDILRRATCTMEREPGSARR